MFADSQIVTGHPWGADLCWLIAVILGVVSGVLHLVVRAVPGALVAFGLAFTALALLLL